MINDIDVDKELESLGSTPEEVAETLRKAGVKGYRALDRDCPVARHLARLTDEPWSVGRVYADCLGLRDDYAYILPDPVSVFTSKFDAGEYPYLEITETALDGLV